MKKNFKKGKEKNKLNILIHYFFYVAIFAVTFIISGCLEVTQAATFEWQKNSNLFYCKKGEKYTKGDWKVCCPSGSTVGNYDVSNSGYECKTKNESKAFSIIYKEFNYYVYDAVQASCVSGYRRSEGSSGNYCNCDDNTHFSQLTVCQFFYGEGNCFKDSYGHCYIGFTAGCYQVTQPYGGGTKYQYFSSKPSGFGIAGTNTTKYTLVSGSYCGGSGTDSSNVGTRSCTSTYLQQGCKNSYVTNLQTKLNLVQGCNLVVDGSFGSSTTNCVKSFQSANGLTNDGIAGQKTMSLLNSKYEEMSKPSEELQEPITYSKVTFDLTGGKFPNGDTTRLFVIASTKKLLSPLTPGKEGYKFLGWYNGSTKYTFGNYVTTDLTLTARWEKTELGNPCDEGDVYDYDTTTCIKLQKFSDTTKTTNNGNTIYTTYTYGEMIPNSSNICNVDWGNPIKAEGSDNTLICDENYTRDSFWISEDTCKSGATCTDKILNCKRTIKGSCYTTYIMEPIEPEPDDTAVEIIDNDKIDVDNENQSDDKTLDEIKENVKTGDILIFVAWVVGIAALGYSVYYFRKNRENNVE